MQVNIDDLVERLREKTAWQRVPLELEYSEYSNMIVDGVKTLYIDTGRASSYDADLVEEGVLDVGIDEEKYILIIAEIAFFKRVQTDVNNIVGYTTDALTVTNADKPYVNIQNTLDTLENERRIVFYKMVRYVFE